MTMIEMQTIGYRIDPLSKYTEAETADSNTAIAIRSAMYAMHDQVEGDESCGETCYGCDQPKDATSLKNSLIHELQIEPDSRVRNA